mmetsp:Transcript_71338/g.201392  ORF Transcript_71338/g.201392 Transcript_71338/m.201392 type:complete len:106 (+) Transcript_71338:73-390(+)
MPWVISHTTESWQGSPSRARQQHSWVVVVVLVVEVVVTVVFVVVDAVVALVAVAVVVFVTVTVVPMQGSQQVSLICCLNITVWNSVNEDVAFSPGYVSGRVKMPT